MPGGRLRRFVRPLDVVDATVEGVGKGANLVYGTVVGESRVPLTLAVAAAIALQLLLPRSIKLIHEPWLLPSLQGAVLVALIASNPFRIQQESPRVRALGLLLLGAVAFNDIVGIVRMVDLLLNGHDAAIKNLSGTDLIRVAVVLWLTNILVFALAFFELDQGGPFKRRAGVGRADFQFPQQGGDLAEKWPDWRPTFVDYLYLSFTNSTSFSPTDTMPLSHWAKLAMMLEGASALVTIGVIAARAVNILH